VPRAYLPFFLVFALLVLTRCGLAPSDLVVAAANGDLAEATRLVKGGRNVNREASGQTPLGAAVYNRHPEIVRLLLDHGADVNGGDPSERGPAILIEAAQAGDSKIVKLLLEHGANPNARGGTFGGSKGVFHQTPLLVAISGGFIGNERFEVVKMLLKSGADPNAEVNGMTPLRNAVLAREERVLELLLEKGADPNKKPSGAEPILVLYSRA
jgi:ankyrin repeat protein